MNEPLQMLGPMSQEILKDQLAFRCCDICKSPEDCRSKCACWEGLFKAHLSLTEDGA